MKKLLSILIIICLVSNLVFAGEWVLKKKDPEKSKFMTKYSGIILPAIPWLYCGYPSVAIAIIGFDITAGHMIYTSIKAYTSTEEPNYIYLYGACSGIFLLYFIRKMNYSGIESRTKEWNKAIEKRDLTQLRKEYMSSGIILTCLGVMMGTCSLLVTTNDNYFENLGDNEYIKDLFNSILILGITCFAGGLLFIRKAKRLDNAVFENDVKTSGLIISPMIRPDMSGIMVVKRF